MVKNYSCFSWGHSKGRFLRSHPRGYLSRQITLAVVGGDVLEGNKPTPPSYHKGHDANGHALFRCSLPALACRTKEHKKDRRDFPSTKVPPDRPPTEPARRIEGETSAVAGLTTSNTFGRITLLAPRTIFHKRTAKTKTNKKTLRTDRYP